MKIKIRSFQMSKPIFRNRKWIIAFSMILVLVLGIVGTVSAAEFPKGETIPAGQTIDDDVFITGANVVVDGNINGMLFATGSTVTINGQVVGDVLLAGEKIIVSETAVIDGNLFLAGADLTLNGQVTGSVFGGSTAMNLGASAKVGRNMFYGGYSLLTASGSLVSKDLYAAGYQALISGAVDRDLTIAAAAVELNSAIGRNATLDVGKVDTSGQATSFMAFNPYISRYVPTTVQPGIRVSSSAKIGGKLTYTSSIDETSQLSAVTSGTVVYQTPVPQESAKPGTGKMGNVKNFEKRSFPGIIMGAAALGIARNFLRLFTLGALALWLLAKPFKKLTDAVYAEPLKSIGWGFVLIAVGFLAAFIVPLVFILVGIVVGFISLGSLIFFWFVILGLALMLAFMFFFFAIFTLSKVIAAYLFGKWIMKGLFKQENEKPWLSLLLGVFLYVLISVIPIIGWLAALTATLIGAGAFWLVYLTKKPAESI
jgi:hypothetical protein